MFEPLNIFFDKIYVLTLARATDRHAHIEKELKGLHYTFFYGIDKNDLDIEQLVQKKLYDPGMAMQKDIRNREMIPGHLACSMGHAMIYKDIIDNNYSRALILEDDVVIDKNVFGEFKNITSELPAGWQLLYLGFDKNEKPPFNAPVKKAFYHLLHFLGFKKALNHTIINNLYPAPFSAHLKKAGFHDCTHAYAVTAGAAKLLLERQTPVVYNADNLLAFTITNGLLRAFVTEPKLIYQQFQVSDTPVSSYLNN